MRLVFMGSAQFAVPVLEALTSAEDCRVVGVVTQPDRPAGRHHLLRPGPVKRLAEALSIPVLQPERVGSAEAVDRLRSLGADLFLVAAYGQMLPPQVLRLAPLGCYNVHASLLPALRGAAPINWAIIRGYRTTGVTIFRMEKGLDTGPVLLQRAVGIGPRETAGELSERLSRLAAEMVLEALPLIASGGLKLTPQDHSRATYAPKLTKADGAIDWDLPAEQLDRFVRGVTPWPGAFTFLRRRSSPSRELRLIIHRARPTDAHPRARPGTFLGPAEDALLVAAGQGALAVETLQPAGGRVLSAADFLNGYRLTPGDRFVRKGTDGCGGEETVSR